MSLKKKTSISLIASIYCINQDKNRSIERLEKKLNEALMIRDGSIPKIKLKKKKKKSKKNKETDSLILDINNSIDVHDKT